MDCTEKIQQSTEVVPGIFPSLGIALRTVFIERVITWECLSGNCEQVLKEFIRQQTLKHSEKVRVASMGKKGSLTAIMRTDGSGSRTKSKWVSLQILFSTLRLLFASASLP